MRDWPFGHIKEFMEREFPILKDIELSIKTYQPLAIKSVKMSFYNSIQYP
jgi:hypothetical protein